jgi:hypothetical protein
MGHQHVYARYQSLLRSANGYSLNYNHTNVRISSRASDLRARLQKELSLAEYLLCSHFEGTEGFQSRYRFIHLAVLLSLISGHLSLIFLYSNLFLQSPHSFMMIRADTFRNHLLASPNK